MGARTFNALKNTLERAHLEPARNIHACRNYCKKNDTYAGNRVESSVEKNCLNVATKDPMSKHTPHDWQQEVIDLCSGEPDERTIVWVYDQEGNKGKTSLCKHLCMKHDGAMYISGKINDMMYGVFQYIKTKKKSPKILLIDIPRSLDNKYVSYSGIEALKNGIFYNTKYESSMVIFDNPHVVIFSNHEPLMDKFSLDRYHIIEI